MARVHERTMTHAYADPVGKLLTYRRLTMNDFGEPWPDYLELGFTPDHVAELIRMATDPDLYVAPSKSFKVWAPLHAWRALAQLRAEEAVPPLILLLEQHEDDDWLRNELPRVLAMIGPSAIPALEALLGEDGVDAISRISIPECFVCMAQDHPGERERCVGVLVRQLDRFATNDPKLNAFLISGLIDLGATEAIGLIRQAFSENQVELSIAGDIEDVEIDMGLRTRRSTPRPHYFERFLGLDGSLGDEPEEELDDRAFPNVPVRRGAKVGRNDPCPCGSGKKFKKCCLNDA